MRYHFTSVGGTNVVVSAENEAEARHLAMVRLHGPTPDPNLRIGNTYTGRGLSLNRKEEETDAE